MFAHEVPELTLDTVSIHSRADSLAHDETDGSVSVGVQQDVRDKGGLSTLGTAANRVPEVLAAAHAITAREHQSQADSLARPLRRRSPRIARPARVRMRRRKPCFLERRRVFGWKVRLLTMIP